MTSIRKAYKTILKEFFPENLTISFGDQELVFRKRMWTIADSEGNQVHEGLRYGDNPDQMAAMYQWTSGDLKLGELKIKPGIPLVSGLSEKHFIQFGKHPGKTNLTDITAGLNIVKLTGDKPAVAIIKHNNPCGVAVSDSILDSYQKAYYADRIAAMGGCVVLSKSCDIETARAISNSYSEVIVAPDYEEGSIEILSSRKNLRIIVMKEMFDFLKAPVEPSLRFTPTGDGGIIVELTQVPLITSADDFIPASHKYGGKTYDIKRLPDEREQQDLLLAWHVASGVTSNSIVMVKNGVTVAIGTGEQDRVGAVRLAVEKAYTKHADTICFNRTGKSLFQLELEVSKNLTPRSELDDILEQTREEKGGLTGAVIASDGFFPFRDGVDTALNEGITAVIQPGGSINDYESIESCNEKNAAMVFTNQRVFRH
ncbi:IMP cyclohydrolase [Myxococcota bacterium]|nr:IMP cyclohydrolase [Myxococcota bacterium]MBU1380525.1 IMP cyclohydrolase [Myxococcota bacterium]MBU1497296.1 IMP cyclohydrolase [Myxococcota bacterium]